MADAGFFKGTSADQDSRFSDKEQRLRKSTKFPPEFDQKVDMKKVALAVIRPWVAKKVEEALDTDDEVVVEYITQLLEDTSKPPDPKDIQISITGFLGSKTPQFMLALWKLLLSAQASPGGVPREFVEEKKLEMRAKNDADMRVMGEVARRQDVDRTHAERLDEIRERERRERRDGGDFGGSGRGGGRGGYGGGRGRGMGGGGAPRGRDSGWGGRGGGPRRDYGPPRDRDRSPPPYRRYPPASRDRSRSRSRSRSHPPPRRRRSPSYSRSRSRSRSPPRRRQFRSPPPRSPPRRGARSRTPLSVRSRSASRSPNPPRQRRRSTSPISRRSRSRSPRRVPPPRRRSPSPSRSHTSLAKRIARQSLSPEHPTKPPVGGGFSIKGAAARVQHQSRSPPRRHGSRSRSRSPGFCDRRLPRSPVNRSRLRSGSPRPRQNRSFSRSRSRSPPPRLPRGSQNQAIRSSRGRSASVSRSRSPVRSNGRRRRRTPSFSSSRSRTRSASPPRRNNNRTNDLRSRSPPYKRLRRYDSRSPSPMAKSGNGNRSGRRSDSPPRRAARTPSPGDHGIERSRAEKGKSKALDGKISKSKWAHENEERGPDSMDLDHKTDLNKAERDAKEKLLRQKVIKSRKRDNEK